MVFFSETSKLQEINSKESQARNLIIKAWRERWTDVQWGINISSLINDDPNPSYIADCILQQALNGPGPNSLVLSYLMYSIYSEIISPASVFKSVSQYEGYHKPFCITSLLDLLENIKDRIILEDDEDLNNSLELSLSLESIVHWLLTCMYSSLENLSDLSISEFPTEVEDSRIVSKCRKLLEHYLTDPYLSSLLYISFFEDKELAEKINKMCKEINKFSTGHHHDDIELIIKLIDKVKNLKNEPISTKNFDLFKIKQPHHLVHQPLNGTIHSIIMSAALLHSPKENHQIVNSLLIIKNLQNLTSAELYCDSIHSCMICLVDSIGKDQEMKSIGFAFLQLPSLLAILKEKLNDSTEILAQGVEIFISNESSLDICDAKLHCSTLELFLSSLQKNNLINDSQRKSLLAKKPINSTQQKQNTGNAILILKAETTLINVLKTLDGDYGKNQDAIQSVLCDMLGKSFELILTAAYSTRRLQQLTSRLVKLNQFSRQVSGEVNKASATRAIIFDISFLMLCQTFQIYGRQALEHNEPNCFFGEFFQDCMVEENMAKNPDKIINRCDQTKVDILLNQYLQGESELKTSLVFWHELCTNAVGAVRELLLAWEIDAINVTEVKKVLDVFRSKVCSLPVCISSWLCAYIQMMPEEQCGKARYMLNHFLNTLNSDDSQDNFKERCALMTDIISKMMNSIQTTNASSLQLYCVSESKPSTEIFKSCWKHMSSRGIIDVETTLNLRNLMEIAGHTRFVQICIQEMMELQHIADLTSYCRLSLGIFHIDLENCTKALLSKTLPTTLHFSSREANFVEPQILALVTLSVDTIFAYFQHLKYKDESSEEDEQPQTKRRRIGNQDGFNSWKFKALEKMLENLYKDFYTMLGSKREGKPQAIFILRFLEEMANKTTTFTNLLQNFPNKIIKKLMYIMDDSIDTRLLLGLYSLNERSQRKNCAQAICTQYTLQSLQNLN